MNKVICIVGPTGVGKTRISVALARHFNLPIINGDVIQMFKGVDILSAKIKDEEKAGVKHYLIDMLELTDNYDVSQFKKEATQLIDKLNQQGVIPIIVGGSGLYIKALLYDYQFADTNARKQDDKWANYSNDDLYDYLKKIDPDQASLLHPNNRVRVQRAIEIYEDTNESKTALLSRQRHELVFDALVLGLRMPREVLYQKIDRRVEEMLSEGLLDEVKAIHEQYPNDNIQASIAIGYQEMVRYLAGNISYDEAVAQIKQSSRRYAKKQMTWFNNQMEVDWIDTNQDKFDDLLSVMGDKVKEFINGRSI